MVEAIKLLSFSTASDVLLEKCMNGEFPWKDIDDDEDDKSLSGIISLENIFDIILSKIVKINKLFNLG